MVKRAAGALLHSLNIDRDSPRTLSTQITMAIRDIVISGGLRSGDRLPSTRTLAKDLGVSRTTMIEVFERLTAEGLLNSTTGSGTFVSKALAPTLKPRGNPASSQFGNKVEQSTEAVKHHDRLLSQFAQSHDSAEQASSFVQRLPHKVRAFTTALPALDMFPVGLWARLNSRHWRNPREVVLGYGDPGGYLPLRQAIASHLRGTQGISCAPEQVFIANGAQQAFQMVASVLVEKGDSAWIENPGAIGARNALLAAGASLVPVDIDDDGIIVEQGLKAAPDFKLAFVTPVHQQPMAVTMGLRRRVTLLEAAENAEAWIIEDDYDSEFYYGNHRLPSLKSIDRTGRVVYVGTFSKTLFPAIRLGYFIVPEPMVDIFQAAVSAYFPGAPSNPQAVLADFIDEGHYATHIRRMRKIYLERYEAFCHCTHKHLAGLLEIERIDAGLHTIGMLGHGLIDNQVAAEAEKENITVTPISRFCIGQTSTNGLVMGFSGIDVKAIEQGVDSLSRVLEKLADRRKK